MDPLSVAGSIAGLVTLADALFRGVFKFCRTVSEASKEIKNLANQLQSFAGVLHSLELLATALEQDGTRTTLQMAHISDATKLLEEIKARLSIQMSKMESSNIGSVHQSLKWPFTKTRTTELCQKLAQQQQVMGLALQAESLSHLVKLLGNDKEIKKELASIQIGVENLQMLTRVEVNAERGRILDFFLKVNPQANLDMARKLRHPGTGTWLTESPRFQQWIETAGSKMWLSGIPGAGKTVLAGAVIQMALEKGKNSPKVGIAFFFCDYKDEKATLLPNILGAMASQLARQNDKAFDEVQKLYESLHPPNGLTKDPESDALQDCLEEIFKCFDQVILVVDGLDECGDNTVEVTEALATIAEYSANVSMALASRDEYHIGVKLQESFSKIPIGARKEDIILYVGSEMDKRVKEGRLRIMNVEIKDEILTRLSQDADGMFRWVSCQLDYICGCPTDADRRVALKELPPTLDATYERMLRRIHRGHPRARNIVQKCLQLLAIKWLRWNMLLLRHAISVPDTLNATLDDHSVVAEAEISLLCSSFIRKSDDGRCFEFSHFTVREFLEREALLKDDELAAYYVSKEVCYATLCQQSLRYLQLRNFAHVPGLSKDEQIQRAMHRNQKLPFYRGATFAWINALRRAPEEPCCLELAKRLFDPCKSLSFISWAVQMCARLMVPGIDSPVALNPSHLQRACSIVLDAAFRPIHLAAMLDLPEVCEYLVQVDPKWDTVSMVGSPLECSIGRSFCFTGSHDLVMQSVDELRKMVVLAYATHRQGQVTAMLRAAGCVMQNPPKKIGQWSLMEGAIISALVSLDFSPVSNLISMGWVVSGMEATAFEKSMALMLHDYPNQYVPGPNTHRSQLAASILCLITSLNSFRVHESDHGFRMCVAAWNTSVKLKCDFTKHADIMDTRITHSLDALIHQCEAAISNDDVEQMQRYLEDTRITGPEIDDDGTKGCGYRMLRRAITSGSVKIVRLFVNRGYSLTKPFVDGVLPIHEAGPCGEEMIKLLFASGASHLDRNAEGNTIWHLAAYYRELDTLSALLKCTGEEKVDALRMQNEECFTPLTLAIHNAVERPRDPDDDPDEEQKAWAATMRLMLDACGHDALCWRCDGSPWHLAARSGSAVVLECLQKSGVPLDIIQQGHCTPLHNLNSLASKECVELLKTLFPTATSIFYQGQTPLEYFVHCCILKPIKGHVPRQGIIEILAHTGTPDDIKQSYCALWNFFCREILSTVRLHAPSYDSFRSIFREILLSKAIEEYEDLKGQSAAIPFFPAISKWGPGWVHGDDSEMVISRTRLWLSASIAPEITECVNSLMARVAHNDPTAPMIANIIHTLLDKGIDINLHHGSTSILEEACHLLECGDKSSTNIEPITSAYAVQRKIFADIVDQASPEQLNAPQSGTGRYLQILAYRGYHYGSAWMIEYLVSKGLDPNIISPPGARGEPLLITLLTKSATPAALSLLELGADPTLRTSNCSWNALHAAACGGQLEFLNSLWSKLQASSVLFPWHETTNIVISFEGLRRTFTSGNALHLAAAGGHLLSLQFLINNNLCSAINSTTAEGYNCLHFAAISGSRELIDYLRSLGLDINQPAYDGSLPIHLAVRSNMKDVVQVLVENGSATCADVKGMTPWMYAKKGGWCDIQNILGNHQSSTADYITGHSRSAQHGVSKLLLKTLESAIKDNDVDTCSHLYSRGVPLHMPMPSCGGCSPLINAFGQRRKDIIQWLLKKRASVLRQVCPRHGGMSTLERVVKDQGLTPYLWEVLDMYLDTAWEFYSLGSPILLAVRSSNHSSLDLIIKHVRQNLKRYSLLTRYPEESVLADIVNMRNHETTPLHVAVERGDSDAVKVLLEAGADVDALDDRNNTAIQLTQDPRLIAQLVSADAKSGWLDITSLDWIISGHNYVTVGCLEFFKKLVGEHWLGHSRNLSDIVTETFYMPSAEGVSNILRCGGDLNEMDHCGHTIMHAALCQDDLSTYLLSTPHIIDCKPFPWDTIPLHLQRVPWINGHWRFFKRRIPFNNLQKMMNLHPDHGISPLCQAAAIDSLDIVDRCMEMGAEIDFEGSSYGSALMAACANCRLKAVKHLVRRGASIVYHGQFGLTSAIHMANGHQKIIQWLLVGQFTEQAKIEYSTFKNANNTSPLQHWSGIQETSMRLTGYYERRPDESLRMYISRLSRIRTRMRGRALPIHQRDPLEGLFNIICYQL